MEYQLEVNGEIVRVDVPPKSKLLWVLREQLNLNGTRYGCGAALCGACMVHIDGRSTFACQLPIAAVAGKSITTIEGLAKKQLHPLQQAWIDEQVPQCGYCQSGQIMRAADLLATNRQPSREDIVSHMRTNLCRCGTYPRIIRAIERAGKAMRAEEVKDA